MEQHGYTYTHHHCSVLLVASLLLASSAWASAATGSAGGDTDHHALMQFRSLITDDPHGALASWGVGGVGNASAPCGWRGVTCGARGRRRGRVTVLDLRGHGLAGSNPPSSLAGLTYLRQLDLSNNSLTGDVPSSLPPSLKRLDLSLNHLTGTIPASLGNLTSLTLLGLTSNNLTGTIPRVLGNLQALTGLYLNVNMLQGSIPPVVFNLSSLQHLVVQHNNLTGTLPPDAGSRLPSLRLLSVDFNRLHGIIPVSLCNASKLEVIETWQNSFSGVIPNCLGALKNLWALLLAFNQLEANVDADWGFMDSVTNCSNLKYLDVSGNKMGGVLPGSIANLSMSMEVLAVSQNMISGQIPQEIGNLANATNGFSSENLVGVGSFGSVYKGTMMINDQELVVAVRVLNLKQRGASQSFIAECETLRCARHRNLVKMLTVCSSIEPGGLGFKALVFDFLPNGNLNQWLHISEHGTHRGLDLAQRIDIAIDVASALEYLHHYRPTPIVHCELKPSNILLDNDMVAHVGDFGLARFVHQDETSFSDITSGWATRRGTIGYAAPEYGLGNGVSIHGDVYSFGVLLLQIFTGKRPTDSSFVDDLSLHSYVQLALQDQQVASVVDQRLLPAQDEESEGSTSSSSSTTEMILSCIIAVLHIGILCSKEVPTDRLLIGDALRELHGLKDKYNRIHN